MAAQKRLCVGSRGGDGGLELSDDTSATDDRVSLTAMLDAIEQVGETSRRLRCSYFDHNIRISDDLIAASRHGAPSAGAWRVFTHTGDGGHARTRWTVRTPSGATLRSPGAGSRTGRECAPDRRSTLRRQSGADTFEESFVDALDVVEAAWCWTQADATQTSSAGHRAAQSPVTMS